VAAVEVWAIRHDHVDLVGRVGPPPDPAGGPAARVTPNLEAVAVQSGALALHPRQRAPCLEDEVVPPALEQRPVDADASLTAASAIAVSAIAPF
jgi:hypothetical protein